jgi:hypothetical protein
MERLSKHLKVKEVTKSITANRLGIDNSPTEEHLKNLKTIAEIVFEPLREHFNVAIGIASGYRSKSLNEAVNGSERSQHCKGQALDIDADIYGELTNKEIFDYIKDTLDFDQMIWEAGTDKEPAWVHVSYVSTESNRKQILKMKVKDGKAQYSLFENR